MARRAMPTFARSQEFYALFNDAGQAFSPGDEYKLVDTYGEKLGVRLWYDWKKDQAS